MNGVVTAWVKPHFSLISEKSFSIVSGFECLVSQICHQNAAIAAGYANNNHLDVYQ